MAPLLNYFQLWLSHLLEVLPQTTTGDNFCDEMNLLFFLANPSADECDDVWMIQLFDDFDL